MKKLLFSILLFSPFVLIGQKYYSYAYDFGNQEYGYSMIKVGNKLIIASPVLADTGFLYLKRLISIDIDNPSSYTWKDYNVSPYHFTSEASQSMTSDSKGNIYLIGVKPVDQTKGEQIGFCMRIKADGTHDWTKDYDSFPNTIMRTITCINDNLFMLCKVEGVFNDFSFNTLTWIDSLGNTIKTKEISTQGIKYNDFNEFYMLPDSGWLNVSQGVPPNTALPRLFLSLKRLDKEGNVLWRTLDYEFGPFAYPSTGSPTLNGNFIGAKQSDSTYVNNDGILVNQPFVVGLFDKDGKKIYEEFEPAADSGRIRPNYMFPLKNGDVMLVGYSNYWGYPYTYDRGMIARISPEGKIKWIRYILDLSLTKLYGIGTLYDGIELDNGDFIFSGMVKSNKPEEFNNIWLLKTDSMGCITPGCSGDNIILTTTSTEDKIKVGKEVFFKVFPNPVENDLIISFYSNSHRAESKINIIDVQGISIYEYKLSKNEGIITLPMNGIPGGIYFISYSSGSSILQTEKIAKR